MDSADKRVRDVATEVWKKLGWGDGEPDCAEGHLCVESVRAGYLAAERRGAWVKVTPETMPKVGQECLLVWSSHVQHCAYVWNGKDFELPESIGAAIGGDDLPGDQAQYWQPLPAPPEEVEL